MSTPPSTAELVPELTQEEEDMYFDLLDLGEEGLTEEEIHKRRTKIFVGGLKFSSDSDVLEEYFGKFGEIKEAVVIRERKSGLSKGYGFVTMKEFKSAVAAIQDKAPKLDGRRCNVCLAYIGQKKNALSPSKRNGYHMITPPLISPHFVNAYGMAIPSPAIIGPGGQLMQYQFGLPPLHQMEPVYQIASPTLHEHRDSTLLQSPLTPIYHPHSPSPSHMMFQHPVLVAHPSSSHPAMYTGGVTPQHLSSGTASTTHQVFPLNDNAMSNNNNNNIIDSNNNNSGSNIPSTGSISPYTHLALCDPPSGDLPSQSGHVIARGHMITPNSNNHMIPNASLMANGGHVITNHNASNLACSGGHLMNGHLMGNGQLVTSTTYVHSPTPSTGISSQRQIFQFHAHPAGHVIIPTREILQQ